MLKHRYCLVLLCLVGSQQPVLAGAPMRSFSPPEGGYSVSMEAGPVPKNTPLGTTMWMHDEKAGGYWVTVAYVPVGSNAATDVVNRSLNGSCNGAVAGMHGKETARYTVNLAGGYPGRQIEGLLPNNQGYFRMRTYLVGNKLYQLVVAGSKSYLAAPKVTEFLNSLTIIQPGTAHAPTTASSTSASSTASSSTSLTSSKISSDMEKHREEMAAQSAALHQKVTENLNRARKDAEQSRARAKAGW